MQAWINETFEFLRLTFLKKWKIWWKIPTSNYYFFIWFTINYSQNRECFDQSCVNRTESVHEILCFLFLSHLLYGICVKILTVIGIFQRATQRPRILLTDNIQSRGCTSITNPNPITSKCLNNNVILIPCGCGWLHQRTQIIMLIGWGHTWGLNYFQSSYLNGQHEILNVCHGRDCHPCVQHNGICRNILRAL